MTSGGSPFIYQYAGNGNFGSGGDGCSAANAHLDPVFSLASDAAGNLYIADFESNRIRRIDHATGIITTYAGSGTPGFSGDNGPATSAQLDAPYGITLDAAGNLYIADFYNYRIRKVDAATGMITTVAGALAVYSALGAMTENGSPCARAFAMAITLPRSELRRAPMIFLSLAMTSRKPRTIGRTRALKAST